MDKLDTGGDAGDQLSQLIMTEFLRIKQRCIESGQIQSCVDHLLQLSAKEVEVLTLIIDGRSCKEIAQQLGIGLATVAKHRMRILKKLNVRDAVELVQTLLLVFDDSNAPKNLGMAGQQFN